MRTASRRATPRLWRASGYSRRRSRWPAAMASHRRRLMSRVVRPRQSMVWLKGTLTLDYIQVMPSGFSDCQGVQRIAQAIGFPRQAEQAIEDRGFHPPACLATHGDIAFRAAL